MIETLTAAAAIEAADAAAKSADVTLRDIRLANGLGGKGVVFLTGDLSNTQAAIDAGGAVARGKKLLGRAIVIPRLHAQMKARLF